MAELVVDLLSATGLIAPDQLALVRGRAGHGSLAQAIVDEGVAPPEGIARSLAVDQVALVDLASRASRGTPQSRFRSMCSSAWWRFRTGSRAACCASPSPTRATCTASTSSGSRQSSRSSSASRRVTTSSPSCAAWRAPPRPSAPAQCSRKPKTSTRTERKRPTISGRRRCLQRATRPARQLDHLPGRRGRRLRCPLRAARGLARRPLPRRRRPRRGTADPETDGAWCHDTPEGSRQARHRRAAEAAGRPHLTERRRRRPDARHPCRDPADRRRREGRDATPGQVETRADAQELGLSDEMRARLTDIVARPPARCSSPARPGPASRRRSTRADHDQSPEVNIITVEDPIEYRLAGVNQVQVNVRPA